MPNISSQKNKRKWSWLWGAMLLVLSIKVFSSLPEIKDFFFHEPVIAVADCRPGYAIELAPKYKSEVSSEKKRARYLEMMAICGSGSIPKSSVFVEKWNASLQQCADGFLPDAIRASFEIVLPYEDEFGKASCASVREVARKYDLISDDESKMLFDKGKIAFANRAALAESEIKQLRAAATGGSPSSLLNLAMRLYDIEYRDPGDHEERHKEALTVVTRLAQMGEAKRVADAFTKLEPRYPWFGPRAEIWLFLNHLGLYRELSKWPHPPEIDLKLVKGTLWYIDYFRHTPLPDEPEIQVLMQHFRAARANGDLSVQREIASLESNYQAVVGAARQLQVQNDAERSRATAQAVGNLLGRLFSGGGKQTSSATQESARADERERELARERRQRQCEHERDTMLTWGDKETQSNAWLLGC